MTDRRSAIPAGTFPRRRLGLLVAFVFIIAMGGIQGQERISREYQIKGVFLFNFAQFTEWPPEAFSGPQAPLVIGILGTDPFGPALEEVVRGEKVNHRPLEVRRFSGAGEINNCHILFISRSQSGRLEEILASLQGRSILTVSDMEEFARRGGMVQFVTRDNKIHLQINLEALKAATLTVSSKLLRSAEIAATSQR
jgi:hypothetical protein